MIIPTAEPFLIPSVTPDNDIGVLLVHGFTGTPKEMREMGQYLSEAGYTVLAPRLAGHATQIEDMDRVHWQDWLHSVEDGYYFLKSLSGKIIIAGLSMGGILSLLFASQFEVDGLIALSTPYEMPPDPRARLLPILWPFLKHVPKGDSDWVDQTPVHDHIDYPAYPTRAIIQLRALFIEMQAALPLVKVPALLIHSLKDGSVPQNDMAKIAHSLGSQDVTTVSLQDSGHVIIRDKEKERVFQEAAAFILRICGDSS